MQSSVNVNIDTIKEQAVFFKTHANGWLLHIHESEYYVGFEILIVVVMKINTIWDVTPCSSLKVHTFWRNVFTFIFWVEK